MMLRTAQGLGLAMAATAAATMAWHPRAAQVDAAPALEQLVPHQFGEWREVQGGPPQIDPTAGESEERTVDHPYDDVLMRTYVNSLGETVLLALAYSRNQKQEVKIHRPDVCYAAQGFAVTHRGPSVLHLAAAAHGIAAARLVARAPGRAEAVSYWIRIGDTYSESAWFIRYHIFMEGIRGRALDGMLVRASRIVRGGRISEREFALQERFLAELVEAMPPGSRWLLVS